MSLMLASTHVTTNTVSATITMLDNRQYGLQTYSEKLLFMQEITDLKTHTLPAWYRAQDKNNACLNLPLLNHFKSTIDNLQLVPIELRGKNSLGAMTSRTQR